MHVTTCEHSFHISHARAEDVQFQMGIVAEIARLPFSICKRIEFRKCLGIPFNHIYDIEQQAVDKKNTKEASLTEMVHYWFTNDPSASITKMNGILLEMGFNEHLENECRRREADLLKMGSTAENMDIEVIVCTVERDVSATDLENALEVEVDYGENEDERARLRDVLEAWIDTRKEDATWSALVRAMSEVSDAAQRAALNIREWRYSSPPGTYAYTKQMGGFRICIKSEYSQYKIQGNMYT